MKNEMLKARLDAQWIQRRVENRNRHAVIFNLNLFAAICLCFLSPTLLAQSRPDHVLSAHRYEAMQFGMTLGSSITILPRPVAEEEIRQIPMVDAHLRFGLPLNFSLVARANSNFITNGAAVGAQWSFQLGDFAIAVGDQQSLWYGFSSIDGFDTDALGWMNHPFMSVGYMIEDVHISLRVEGQFITYRSTRVGSQEVSSDRNAWAGTTFALTLEQPFFKQTHLMLGLRMNYTNAAVQSWLAFSTIRDTQLFPEFIFGFVL